MTSLGIKWIQGSSALRSVEHGTQSGTVFGVAACPQLSSLSNGPDFKIWTIGQAAELRACCYSENRATLSAMFNRTQS